MSRTINSLGAALILVVAVCAVAASAASAEATSDRFTAQTYPVTLHGESEHPETTFELEAGTLSCDTTLHGELGEASQTLTLKPTYTNCTAFGFVSATVASEGCDFLYHVTTKTGADRYQAHVDVVCPAEQSIKITAGTCKAEIKAQTGLTTVDFEDMTTTPQSLNDITLTDTVEGVEYTVTQDGFLCPFNGTGKKTGGEFVSGEATTLTGRNPITGAANGIHIG